MERHIGKRLALLGGIVAGFGLSGCGEPVPPGIPQGTPVTTGQATEQPGKSTIISGAQTSPDTQLGPGDSTQVYPGDVIEGDVFINNQWTTDRDPNTGQIIIVQANGTVYAPYGADIQHGVMGQSDGGWSTIRRDAAEMQQNGCGTGNGCQEVLGNYWPSGQGFQAVDTYNN